jgi:hypothetical protein
MREVLSAHPTVGDSLGMGALWSGGAWSCCFSTRCAAPATLPAESLHADDVAAHQPPTLRHLLAHELEPRPAEEALQLCVLAVLAGDAYNACCATSRSAAHAKGALSAAQPRHGSARGSGGLRSGPQGTGLRGAGAAGAPGRQQRLLTCERVLRALLQVQVNGVALRDLSAAGVCDSHHDPGQLGATCSGSALGGNGGRNGTDGADDGSRYGTAVYALLSCANHSCRPNATLR